MKRTIKKATLLAVVLVLIVGICVPAFAAYPRVKLYSRPRTAYRGYYMYHTYYLSSNSYSYRNGYRANFDGFISRNATGTKYAKWDISFTGSGYQKIRTAVYNSWPRGTYKTNVRTFCRSSAYDRWSFVRQFNWYFNVR